MARHALLRTLCDELASKDNWLIGYYETASETDVLRPSLSNLYSRWLEDASYWDQARILYDRHKGNLPEKAGAFIGRLLGKSVPNVGDAIEKGMQELIGLSKDLSTGGMQFDPVPYEIVFDLVSSLSTVTEGRPALLVLDAWEQCQNPKSEAGTLKKFLSNLSEWPASYHVILAIRDDPRFADHNGLVEELCKFPVSELFDLKPMRLDEDPAEADRAVSYVQSLAPGAQNIDSHELLSMIAGNPAVIESLEHNKPETFEDLKIIVSDAHRNSYPEVENILLKLLDDDKDLLTVALRLAILHEFTSNAAWEHLTTIALNNAHQDALIELESRGLLRGQSPPSFGHRTRYDAAGQYLRSNKNLRPFAKKVTSELIDTLSGKIKQAVEEDAPFAAALKAMLPMVRELGIPDEKYYLCLTARTLFGLPLKESEINFIQKSALQSAREIPEARYLIAMGLVNTLNHAKEANKLDFKDALRQLLKAFPDDDSILKGIKQSISDQSIL